MRLRALAGLSGRGGRNYGWRNREGAHDNVTSRPPAFTPLIDPVHEYPRTSGQSITGGYVYRGDALGATYRGRYFFGDFVASRVWSIALTIQANGEASASDLRDHTVELGGTAVLSNVASFGVDADGELYIVSYGRGVILKIIVPRGARKLLRRCAIYTPESRGVPLPRNTPTQSQISYTPSCRRSCCTSGRTRCGPW